MRFYQSPDEYTNTASAQAALARNLAKRIINNEPIENHERGFISAVLRTWANTLPLHKKRPAGRSPEFCHGTAAWTYAIYRAEGMTHGQAVDNISDAYDVSRTAIEKAVKSNQKEVDELIKMRKDFAENTNLQE